MSHDSFKRRDEISLNDLPRYIASIEEMITSSTSRVNHKKEVLRESNAEK
jgi:hypothetical protein